MKKIRTVRALEQLGRVRLSQSFFMRDFLHSEIANFYGLPNIPDDPTLAIEVGRRLCEDLLEPLNATFGRIAIRSAYRSPTVNAFGNAMGHNCASNEKNYARHIWDRRDAAGSCGPPPASLFPGLPIGMPWAPTGNRWPTGSTTICPTAAFNSFPSARRSTSAGMNVRPARSTASSDPPDIFFEATSPQ
jgi:hypothetical protein